MQPLAIVSTEQLHLRAMAVIMVLSFAIPAIAVEPKVDHAAACKVGRAESCLEHGLQLYSDKAGRAGKAKAAKTFERGCDLGNADCCSNLTTMLMRGDGLRRDPIKAMKTADRGCTLGSGLLCTHVGKMWLEGANGLPKDVKRALGYLDQGCRGGQAAACGAICIGRSTNEFGPPDAAAAFAACALGCKLSDGQQCLRAADISRHQLKKPSESVSLYEQACNFQLVDGCRQAAGLLLGAEGVPVDVLRARAVLGVCCAGKHDVCCTHLQRLEAMRAKQAGTDKAPLPPLELALPPTKAPDLPAASRTPPPPAAPAPG